VLWTVRLSPDVAADPNAPITALILLDLHDYPQPAEVLLGQVFGLTRAECKVARFLGAGVSLTEISKSLNIGLGTVRTHLKAIFSKTATRRQGELIALLSHLAHVQGFAKEGTFPRRRSGNFSVILLMSAWIFG
jgi:DNA-binding CsgD family transcriptional regulator